MDLSLDIHFDRLPCSDLNLDLENTAGAASTHVTEGISFDEEQGGCRMYGNLELQKVAGDFHVAAGTAKTVDEHLFYDANKKEFAKFDASHLISRLSFGTELPGHVNPLDKFNATSDKGLTQFKYSITLVPTEYVWLNGTVLKTHQFSATLQKNVIDVAKGTFPQPGVFFKYGFSPIMIRYSEKRRSFLQFITSVCAILGGVFTVSSMIDSVLYRSALALKKIA